MLFLGIVLNYLFCLNRNPKFPISFFSKLHTYSNRNLYLAIVMVNKNKEYHTEIFYLTVRLLRLRNLFNFNFIIIEILSILIYLCYHTIVATLNEHTTVIDNVFVRCLYKITLNDYTV